MAIHEKYNIKRYATLLRIGGAGFKTRSSRRSLKSTKWRRFKLLYDKSYLPVEYVLGGGRPLNPYLLGKIQRYFLEYSLLIKTMGSWLNHLRWYCRILMDPSASLDEILQVPVVETHWFIRREDPNLTRWGLIWRAHNIVQDVGVMITWV